jgi:hypothetical protein
VHLGYVAIDFLDMERISLSLQLRQKNLMLENNCMLSSFLSIDRELRYLCESEKEKMCLVQ